jgi:hypothetical protein
LIDSAARCFRTPSASPRCTSFLGRPRRSGPSTAARARVDPPLDDVPRPDRDRIDVDIAIDVHIPADVDIAAVDARRRADCAADAARDRISVAMRRREYVHTYISDIQTIHKHAKP